MYIAAQTRLRRADVTEIRLAQTILLLLRPECAWPVELARQRLDAHRLSGVLHGFRQRPLAVAQLRLFWHCHHLAGSQLSDEALLVALATAIECRQIEALVLPGRHGVSSVSAAAAGEGSDAPTRAPPTVPATPAQAMVAPQPPVVAAQWDIRRRLTYVLPKAAENVPSQALRGIILGLATPSSVTMTQLHDTLSFAENGLTAGCAGGAAPPLPRPAGIQHASSRHRTLQRRSVSHPTGRPCGDRYSAATTP